MTRPITRTLATALAVAATLAPAAWSAASASAPATIAGPQPRSHDRGQWGKLPSDHVHRRHCTAVAHVGDSTTVESRDQQIAAYAARFERVVVDGGGGRAVLQKLSADPHTGAGAVAAIRRTGFAGCWVVALGTNDAANIAAGANYDPAEAIDAMLAAIDPTASTPVAWVEVFTTKSSGYWERSNMAAWNTALRAAAERWPNLEILPWTERVAPHPEWLYDGIHHTSHGRAERTNWIADAADRAFNG